MECISIMSWTSGPSSGPIRRMETVGLVLTGLAVGATFGTFGAGGSAFATPVLALLGVPGVVAVASPLPAMVPASIAGAHRYARSGNFDARLALLAIGGGAPGVLLGALASAAVRGNVLVLLSGVVLLVVGARVLVPDSVSHVERAVARRGRTRFVVTAAFAVGLLTGLLANGGGFLLVPLFVVGLGLSTTRAAGTSMIAVAVLIIPTLIAHWTLGHIDWSVALAFAAGLVPGSIVGAQVAHRIHPQRARRVFGAMLVVFALWFLVARI